MENPRSLQSEVTALVTCAGSMPGIGVINALKKQNEIPVRVVAVDMNPLSAGFYLSDRHAQVPCAADPSFIAEVLRICRDEGATIVFPVIDEELQVFADHQKEFAGYGIRVVSNKPEVVRTTRDKYRTFQFCQQNGIRVPRTFLSEELVTAKLPAFPLIVKPRDGRGTSGVFKIRNRKELDFFVSYVPNAIVQEFIEGQEFTIDVLTDFDGQILSVVPKARLETKAGMQVKGRTVKDERLMDYGAEIVARFGLAPHCNIQCILNRSDLYLIEVNPKFSASLPFTVTAGVNAPLLLVKMHLGKKVKPILGRFRDGLLMLRYWQEVYVSPARQRAEADRKAG